ncbi:MAG: type III secretion system protein SctP [Paraburkholderia sp.]|nr:type III secretion system protein SctP [Paraburkholderia sp.]
MTYIGSRHLRIIPGDPDAPDAPHAADQDEFDYAALLKGRRAWRRPARDARTRDLAATDRAGDGSDAASGHDERDPGESGAPVPFADIEQTSEQDRRSKQDTEAAAAALSEARAAIGAQVARAAAPVVSAVFGRQQRMVALLAALARHIGAFCGDPAVTEAGNWEVELPLDPGVLPHTTLYLSLSRFRLQLRFDTQDPAARHLLFEHSGMLERELDTILRAWGEPRDIELTLW